MTLMESVCSAFTPRRSFRVISVRSFVASRVEIRRLKFVDMIPIHPSSSAALIG
jgi:hypothetical protein